MSIGQQIAQRRNELHLTQAALAEKTGVSFQTVSAWERGVYRPETDRLQVLAAALGTTAAWLLEDRTEGPHWDLHDEMFDVGHMYDRVKFSASALQLHQTAKALCLMQRFHAGQTRKGKDRVPYAAHPLLIACHALAMGLRDDVLLASALLHDVAEDCGVAADELDVSGDVQKTVRLLTFERKEGESRHEAKARYYAAIRSDGTASMVKILDRCNNVSHMASGFSREKIISYINETEEFVLPLTEHVKNTYPEYSNAAFLVKYQTVSVMEALKRTLLGTVPAEK